MAVVTLLTVQNTQTVSRVEVMSGALVTQQAEAVLRDIAPGAVKTGALGNAEVINAVASLKLNVPLVVDPVMISKHGHALLADEAREALRLKLMPVTTLLTPNSQEAAALWGRPVETIDQAVEAARALGAMGPKAVLVKGGHIAGLEAVDVLFHAGVVTHFRAARVDTKHTHGTGCTYSAAITARLAKGESMVDAIAGAKVWLTEALRTAPGLGHGIGPVNHFAM